MKRIIPMTAVLLLIIGTAYSAEGYIISRTEKQTFTTSPSFWDQERTYSRTEERTVTDPLFPERTYSRTEERTVTDPLFPERAYSRTEERTVTDPLFPEGTYSRTEERTVTDPLLWDRERTYSRTEERTVTDPLFSERTYFRSWTGSRSSLETVTRD
jgi:hypothetical protein